MTSIDDLTPSVPAQPAPLAAGFPDRRYPSAGAYFGAYAREADRAASSVDPAALNQAAEILLDAYRREATVFSCGNGGSAAVANHLQCDHLKNVRNSTDLASRVVSLNANVELLTAVANDIGYEDVFRFQFECQSRPGDVLIAISSSGNSANIVRALAWARDHDRRTIAITGFAGGAARSLAEVSIHVDCTNYGITEDMHQAIMHALAQYIRHSRMTAAAVAASVF